VRVIKCFGGVESARDVQEERAARLILPVGFTSLRGYPHRQSILSARSYPTNTHHAYTKESLDENTRSNQGTLTPCWGIARMGGITKSAAGSPRRSREDIPP